MKITRILLFTLLFSLTVVPCTSITMLFEDLLNNSTLVEWFEDSVGTFFDYPYTEIAGVIAGTGYFLFKCSKNRNFLKKLRNQKTNSRESVKKEKNSLKRLKMKQKEKIRDHLSSLKDVKFTNTNITHPFTINNINFNSY